MRRLSLAVCGLLVLAAVGCSNDAPSAQNTPAASAQASATSAEPTAGTPTPSNSESTPPGSIVPAYGCLKGTYRLAGFVGVGENATYGTGQGGDVTATFTGSTYRIKGAGKKPMTTTLAGTTASLLIDGTIDGTFTGKENKADFTLDKTTGQGTLSSGGQQRTITMKQVANVLSPTGSAALGCTAKQLTVIFDEVRLEFER